MATGTPTGADVAARAADKCVLDSCRSLQMRGHDITYLPVRQDGLIDLAQLEAAIRPDTALVSIMTVNNEIGEALRWLRAVAEDGLGTWCMHSIV